MGKNRRTKWIAASALAITCSAAATSFGDVLTLGTWAEGFSNTNAGEAVSGSGSSGLLFVGTSAGESIDIPITTPETLAVGSSITLSGTVGWNSASPPSGIGNEQFRFGMFNTNSSANDLGWAGYLSEAPNAATSGLNAGLNPTFSTAGDGWENSGAHYTLPGSLSGTVTNAGAGTYNSGSGTYTPTYNFTITATYIGTNNWSVVTNMNSSDGNYAWQDASTDTTSGSTSSSGNTTFNEIGFFFGSGTGIPSGGSTPQTPAPGASDVQFSNVSVVAAVPEPASIGLVGITLGLLFPRRRKLSE